MSRQDFDVDPLDEATNFLYPFIDSHESDAGALLADLSRWRCCSRCWCWHWSARCYRVARADRCSRFVRCQGAAQESGISVIGNRFQGAAPALACSSTFSRQTFPTLPGSVSARTLPRQLPLVLRMRKRVAPSLQRWAASPALPPG